MGRHATTPIPSLSRGLSAISLLTDAEKARLFYHLQTAHVNAVAARSHTVPQNESDVGDKDEQTVYFSNVYSAVAQSKSNHDREEDMILDTRADQFIMKSPNQFVNMNEIPPVAIKTADGDCHLAVTHRGDAKIKSYDDNGMLHTMIIPDALYCKGISVNLISAI